jgi:hypothetical protein
VHEPAVHSGIWQPFSTTVHVLPHIPQFWTVLVKTQLSPLVAPPLTQQTSPEGQGRAGTLPPGGMGEQVPGAPCVLHASQLSLQLVLQHTPSTQNSLWHSAAPAQPAPFGFVGLQAPARMSHHSFMAHCPVVVHGSHTPALQ